MRNPQVDHEHMIKDLNVGTEAHFYTRSQSCVEEGAILMRTCMIWRKYATRVNMPITAP